MRVKTYMTNQEWLEEQLEPVEGADEEAADDGNRPDPARQEIDRALSDIIRSRNLIVLTGLGTSLCVKDGDDNAKAPTMGVLWQAVQQSYAAAQDGRPAWDEVSTDRSSSRRQTLTSRSYCLARRSRSRLKPTRLKSKSVGSLPMRSG